MSDNITSSEGRDLDFFHPIMDFNNDQAINTMDLWILKTWYFSSEGAGPGVLNAPNDPQLGYIHFEHRGAPVAVSDPQGEVIWQAHYQPFGEVEELREPDGDGEACALNLRYPGQYHDRESGYYYNYFRDYDPTTGRYLQSDPIGLRGGLNTFVYTLNNPVNGIDIYGLEMRVYSSDAWGVNGLNHAFVYSTTHSQGIGVNGSSGYALGDGVGDLSSPYSVVTLPPGMSESRALNLIKSYDGWNTWLYFPFINDCHNDLERAFNDAGINYPGAPNGRLDFDNSQGVRNISDFTTSLGVMFFSPF